MGILRICAKCSDRFNAVFIDAKGNETECDSYVPEGIGFGGDDDDGDYVMLDVDMKTGQILNWKSVSDAKVIQALKKA